MGRVTASVVIARRVAEAEALWYDLARRPAYHHEWGHVVRADGTWPQAGELVWTSPPNGRGRVREQVLRYEPRVGQEATVEDDRLRGTQRLRFTPKGEGGCEVTIELEYRLKDDRPGVPLVDWLFVRRPVRDSLQRTLDRLRREVEAEPPAAGGAF